VAEVQEVNARALDAVARELSGLLNDARAALEAAGEAPEDAASLVAFADLMHAARGVLRVIEVYGASLLAEEMEQSARVLVRGGDPRQRADGLDGLMRAAVQLPAYVERVLGGGRDLALVLLPLLNDLRAVRGASLLSEGTLLSLNLTSDRAPAAREAQPGEPALGVAQWARRLRPRFQVGLLGLIRDGRDPAALPTLVEVAGRIEATATTRPLYQLWWVVGAVLEALGDGGLEESVTLKRLLGHADRELRRLYEIGEERYSAEPPLELLNNLLYYVARSRSSGPRIAAVRASFRLAELLPVDDAVEQERESLSAPSVKLMHTVAAAIKEDLGRVKDALDLFTRKGGQPEELEPQVELLKKIGDTLAVLGLGSLREQVQAELGRLGDIVSRRTAADADSLIGIATVLINVEDNLDESLVRLIMPPGVPVPELSQDPEFRQVAEAVLRECSVNLARIKDLVAQALEPGADVVGLDSVQPLARGVAAGLLMLGKARATDLTTRIGRAVGLVLRPRDAGVQPALVDRLADAIVSVEYYMETLQAGRSDPWYMLDNAERCLGAVEAGLAGEAVAPTVHVVVESAPSAEPEPTPIVEIEAPAEPAASAAIAPEAPAAAPEQLDEELLPVFIEEAREETAALRAVFPLWEQNPADRDSLARVRRGFHTLKGSGRMVGAMSLGQFAWSVESLLNRLMEGTRERTPGTLALLRDAVAFLPDLIDRLESREAMPAASGQLASAAFALAEGREPPEYHLPPRREAGVDQTQVVERPDEATFARMLGQVPPAEAAPAEVGTGTPPPHTEMVPEAAPAAYEPTLVIAAPTFEQTPEATAEPAPEAAAIEPVQAVSGPESAPAPETGLQAVAEPEVGPEVGPEVEEFLAADEELLVPEPELPSEPSTLEMSLQDIYRREVQAHLEVLREFLRHAWIAPGPHPVTEDLYRACHTLRGASRTAQIQPAIRLADPLHRWLRRLFDHDRAFTEEGLATLADSVAAFEDILDHIEEASGYFTHLKDVVASICAHDLALEQALAAEPAVPPAEPVEPVEPAPAEPEPEPVPEPEPEPRLEIDHLIPGMVVQPEARIGPEPSGFEQLLPPVEETRIEGPVPYLATPEEVEARQVAAPEPPPEPTITSDDYFRSVGPEPEEAPGPVEVPEAAAPAAAPEPPPAPVPAPVLPSFEQAVAREVEPAPSGPPGVDYDPDIAAIFCEEATELLEGADAALGALRAERGSRERIVELQRVLHTVKGGARMAGVAAMGDLSHELESLLVRLGGGAAPLEGAALDVVQATLDELSRMRDFVSAGRPVAHARDLITRIRLVGRATTPVEAAPPPAAAPLAEAAAPAESPAPEAEAAAFGVEALSPEEAVAEGEQALAESAAAELEPSAASTPESVAPPAEPAAPLPGREAAPERAEMARVDADLLDAMLNNAGEASIFRARVEQQLASVEFNLAELGRVVQRLKDQLRKLEIETEAQILHRHIDATPRREDFDPLELDRYSTIQQYSRGLAETASDVASVQGLLGNLTREAQNLLVQQGRVISDLQNGLMRTRMVPFQRHVQRLTRIVRQVAAEYGKSAELTVTGAAGELDRQVLERMLPPFEHLLRNAVVHGIETPEERDARGKPAVGSIGLSLRREGAEVVIIVSDDGGGIPLRMVRDRAVALGLITPKQDLTDDQALQLILEPGFSTASKVTQSAGRGVGMDVVATEIKKLGGSLYIESDEGRGTRFTIRLPFTLAISHALVVRVGEELFALPMPTVEGVVRVPVEEVRRQLAGEAEGFEYGGQKYRFQHLAGFVGSTPGPMPDSESAVPVILVRAGEHSTGIVADELAGSREIVVKSVGPQIAGIRGIAGATILGDGRICIILDVAALVRSEWRARAPVEPRAETVDRRAFALVVDDSITVRRVTQRLLERNGMRVMTAKDGLDAVGVLQEHVPDVILLDIEMPRMDGYEVASHVRNDARLKDVPIVMITSRVGEKHRARAIELGVDEYLGKPYQESQLLEVLEPLLKRRRAS
jgi:chemosensory pili system protein ChpA (sensor histidine kinase/response regulator)